MSWGWAAAEAEAGEKSRVRRKAGEESAGEPEGTGTVGRSAGADSAAHARSRLSLR